MRSRPFRQFVVVATLFVSVGAIGSAVTFSRSHAVDRLQRAIYQDEAPADSHSAETVPQTIKAPKASPDAAERPRGGLNSRDIESLDKQLRSFKVRLSPEGTVKGRMSLYDSEQGSMSVLNDLQIVFLQNGEVIAEATPDTAGTFTASLEPGVYALVAAGPQGYAAYGIQVVKPDVLKSVSYQEVQDDIAIDSLAIPPRDFETATRLARTYIPKDILKNGAKSPEAAVTEPLPAAEGETPSVGGSDPDTALRNHSVVIQSDGSLMGRMRRLHPQTGQPLKIRRLNVFLVQENSILAQATVSEAGMFKFRNVPSGMYSFVASGTDGLAAFAFQAVNQSVAQADTPNELTLVSFAADGGMGTSGSTTGSENAQQATQQLVGVGGNSGAGLGGAGGAGGGVFGQGGQGGQGGNGISGGAGAGGGGLGGLAGAAGAAGIAAAAGLDSESNDPASPKQP